MYPPAPACYYGLLSAQGLMMRRREFLGLLGSAAMAWPCSGRAQQHAMPVIGFAAGSNSSPGGKFARLMAAFHQGLSEGGYVEGQNVAIEYRWAGGQYDRLPELLADLVHRQVKLIVASGGLATALHARAATKTIPILFIAGFDPVQLGLGSSFAQPGSNATGVNTSTSEMGEKRLEWLHRLLPTVDTVAAVVNPKATVGTVVSKIDIERLADAARGFGQKLIGLEASTESDLETMFATAVRAGAGALSVSGEPFFISRSAQIIALAARYRLPTIYPFRDYVEDGGLMSYGYNLAWAYRQLGDYASRILKGEKPGDLPIQRPKEFELLVNLKTVKALGLTVPRVVLTATTEFIE
jgi:putative ABC transport system substrate-binding protein